MFNSLPDLEPHFCSIQVYNSTSTVNTFNKKKLIHCAIILLFACPNSLVLTGNKPVTNR